MAAAREHTARTRRPAAAVLVDFEDTTEPFGFVLVCNRDTCGHTWEPSFDEIATGRTACPLCDGWTFLAHLVEPGGDD